MVFPERQFNFIPTTSSGLKRVCHAFSCDGVLVNCITALCSKPETIFSFTFPVSARMLSLRAITTSDGYVVSASPPHEIHEVWSITDLPMIVDAQIPPPICKVFLRNRLLSLFIFIYSITL